VSRTGRASSHAGRNAALLAPTLRSPPWPLVLLERHPSRQRRSRLGSVGAAPTAVSARRQSQGTASAARCCGAQPYRHRPCDGPWESASTRRFGARCDAAKRPRRHKLNGPSTSHSQCGGTSKDGRSRFQHVQRASMRIRRLCHARRPVEVPGPHRPCFLVSPSCAVRLR
jgi:hypothetical protein